MNNTSSGVSIPFVDLYAQYLSIKSEIDEAIAAVITSSSFIRGPFVEEFEQDFAKAVGAPHCVSCANGTDALYIAMKALRVRAGDEVIVPAMSWISTSETVTQSGATVVFCDIDPLTYTIDATKLESVITSRTVGIIPVHLYGQPADMGAVIDVAERHALWVIEDCAQAHLAEFRGRQVGGFGVAATFSFYPGKNLGAMGDAGAIITADRALAERMAMFARHGGLVKGEHRIEGVNSRLDGLQAAILSVKLRYLPAWTKRRDEIARRYSERLANISGIVVPRVAEERKHVWHLYVICHDQRDALAAHLKEQGIQTQLNYPRALPFLPCYRRLEAQVEDFPGADALQRRCLSLPMFAELAERQIEAVSAAVSSFTPSAAQRAC
jgi:dTDP-4-amino-4,6-dideoxygalactose transaminase